MRPPLGPVRTCAHDLPSRAPQSRDVDALIAEVLDAMRRDIDELRVDPMILDQTCRKRGSEATREMVVAEPGMREVTSLNPPTVRERRSRRAQMPQTFECTGNLGIRDRIEPLTTARHALDQPCIQQHRQMFAGSRRAHSHCACEFPCRTRRSIHQHVQEVRTYGCRKRSSDHREVAGHVVSVRLYPSAHPEVFPPYRAFMTTHTYETNVVWQGCTADGYRLYTRAHTATATPADAALTLSADPHFRGDATALNPEQLVVMAASSCQLLSFLTVAATRGIDVLNYVDAAQGYMDDAASPVALSRILLRPVVTVASDTHADAVRAAMEQAHERCYIANSLRTTVKIQSTVVTA